jgi:hypothetical protein
MSSGMMSISSCGCMRRRVDTRAIGLVTTHDLALTSVADGLDPAGANVHFDKRLFPPLPALRERDGGEG